MYKKKNGTITKYIGVWSGFKSNNQPDNATQAATVSILYRFNCIYLPVN